MFFDTAYELLRVASVGTLAYLVLVVTLRLAGKRTLAELNAFDLVATVAFGSVLATALLSSTVSLAEAALAFGVLACAQYVIAKASALSPVAASVVRARPTALVVNGSLCGEALRRERVTVSDVRAAVRASGQSRLEDVSAVVLETDGSISVVAGAGVYASALADVAGWHGGA